MEPTYCENPWSDDEPTLPFNRDTGTEMDWDHTIDLTRPEREPSQNVVLTTIVTLLSLPLLLCVGCGVSAEEPALDDRILDLAADQLCVQTCSKAPSSPLEAFCANGDLGAGVEVLGQYGGSSAVLWWVTSSGDRSQLAQVACTETACTLEWVESKL